MLTQYYCKSKQIKPSIRNSCYRYIKVIAREKITTEYFPMNYYTFGFID